VDISKDELGLGEQEEEVPQQEIDISTTDYQLSTKPSPNASILSSTLPLDEQQLEAKISKHMEEVQEPILEQIYTTGSLGNMFTWGEKQIPELVDEVVDTQAISYD
jgi:hypothetical protein